MVLHDQHVHSKFSADSNQELEAYIKKANDLGCKYFVTTEHLDYGLVEFNTNWTVDFENLKKELRYYQTKYPDITLLLGVEVGYRREYIPEILKQIKSQHFDLINLSIHDVEQIDFYWPKYFEKYGIEVCLNKYFDEMIYATKTFQNYQVLSHIDYAFKTVYSIDRTYTIDKYEDKIKQVFTNLIKNGKALEINTKVQEAINDNQHTKYLLNLYKELGGQYLTLSSDSHSVDRYLSSFNIYIKMIKDAGFDYLVYFIDGKINKFYI